MAYSFDDDITMNMEIDTNTFPTFYIYFDSIDKQLKELYYNRCLDHNNMVNMNKYPDSGFDLLIPDEYSGDIPVNTRKKIDYKIVGVMKESNICTPFYIYPRSSISKTPLQMCNNVGIIDSGYRGHLMSYFANHGTVLDKDKNSADSAAGDSSFYNIAPHSRLTQVCSPNLKPFYVKMVESMDDFEETERGDGGFGSTG